VIQKKLALIYRIGPFWRFYYSSDYVRAIKLLNEFVHPFVQRAVNLSVERNTEQDSNRHAQGENFTEALSQFTTDKKVLRDQLVNTLLAGRDTTAATLSWLFYEMAYHPEMYSKLREEVHNTVGSQERPTYEDLKNMKYLQYCLNEGNSHVQRLTKVLRLYPVIPVNGRTALVDTTLPRGGGPSGLDVYNPPKMI